MNHVNAARPPGLSSEKMHRRNFLALSAGALASRASALVPPQPRVALTFDDFAWRPVAEQQKANWRNALLEPLAKRKLQAAAFVAGSNVDDPEGRELVKRWLAAGHLIGNHTYLHRPYHRTVFQAFSVDVLRNHAFLTSLGANPKFFRFPMLREGETREKRDQMRAYLKDHGYSNGHVTIDASDWFIDQRLRTARKKNAAAPLDPYLKFYLAHLLDRAQYYNALGSRVTNTNPPHTLLLHYNVLNAVCLEDVLRAFESKGYKWIDASSAFADPFFRKEPDTVPAGESLIWSLAKQNGALPKDARYPAEDGDYMAAEMNKLGL